MYACIYIYIYRHVYTYIDIYKYTYTYTYLVSYEKCSSELCYLQRNSAQTKSCNLATMMMLQASTLTNCTPWLRARWSVLAHVVFAIIRHVASLWSKHGRATLDHMTNLKPTWSHLEPTWSCLEPDSMIPLWASWDSIKHFSETGQYSCFWKDLTCVYVCIYKIVCVDVCMYTCMYVCMNVCG